MSQTLGYLLVGASVLLGLGANGARAATPAAELAAYVQQVGCVADAYPETLHGEQTGRVYAVVASGTSASACAADVRASLVNVLVQTVQPGLLLVVPRHQQG